MKPWQAMILQLETREMPPKGEPQPTDVQRKLLIDWTRWLLDDEARARAGDPGRVPLRRLSNTEYNNDLTGVDLQPTRDFPADGAAGEGFTNAAEALSMSPALMSKYMNAARSLREHAVDFGRGESMLDVLSVANDELFFCLAVVRPRNAENSSLHFCINEH